MLSKLVKSTSSGPSLTNKTSSSTGYKESAQIAYSDVVNDTDKIVFVKSYQGYKIEKIEGTLQLKEDFGFWSCKNYPYCENKEQACPYCKKGFPQRHANSSISCNVCEQQIEKFPEVGCNGFIQQQQNNTNGNYFWGCTEFFNPQKRCRYKRSTRYAQDEKKYSKSTSKSGHGSKRPNSFNKQYPNHGKPWTKAQNDKLKKLVAENKSTEFISQEMGRSDRSINLQRDRLGLW